MFATTIRQIASRISTRSTLPGPSTLRLPTSLIIPPSRTICSHNHAQPISSSLRSIRPSLSRSIPPSTLIQRIRTVQVRGFKVRSAVKRMCEACFVVRRKGRVYVLCKKFPKHKQNLMIELKDQKTRPEVINLLDDEGITNYPQISSQAKEHPECPSVDPTLPPMLQPSGLHLWPDERYHFTSPHQTFLFGFPINLPKPLPDHPPSVPPHIHWIYIIGCMIERSGLAAGKNADDANEMYESVSSVIENLCHIAEHERWSPEKLQFALTIYTAFVLTELGRPLRRNGLLILASLKRLSGGRSIGSEPAVVFRHMTDILRREFPAKVRKGSLIRRTSDMSTDFAYDEPRHAREFRQGSFFHVFISLTNWERLKAGQTTSFFPNDRNQVIQYYSDPKNAPKPHAIPNPKAQIAFGLSMGDAVETSSVRLEDLKEIDLGMMRCHKRHQGTFLVCRVLTLPVVGYTVAVAIEDRNGRAIALSMDNLCTGYAIERPYKALEDLYPIGTVLAIKEPYLCLGKTTGIAEIRVTSPTDMETLPLDDPAKWRFEPPVYPAWHEKAKEVPVKPSPEVYKDKGNAAIKIADDMNAIKFYTLGIQCCRTKEDREAELALRLNRCLANINLGRFGPALADCLKIEEIYIDDLAKLITEPQRHKLVYRKLLAAYGYRAWNLAKQTIEECKTAKLDDTKWKPYVKKIESRLKETKGEYDMKNFLMSLGLAQELGGKEVDYADFKVAVEVRTMKAKGRGMFTTRKVKAGEVLLIEKDLVKTESDNSVLAQRNDSLPPGLQRGSMNPASFVVNAIIADPSLVRQINSLTPNNTSFSPFMSEEERVELVKKPLESFNVDDIHIKDTRNSFGEYKVAHSHSTLQGPISLFNHSCLPSARKITIGKFSIVWANNDMPEGSELTFSYLDPERYYASRKLSLQRTWNFKCACQSCLDDAQENDAERERLMTQEWPQVWAEWEKASESNPLNFNEDEAFLANVWLGNKPKKPPGGFTSKPQLRMLDTSNMTKMIGKAKELVEPVNAFIDKLEKTYKKDRKAPKNALIRILTQSQAKFCQNFPKGCEAPSDGYEYLLKLQGCEYHTPSERKKTGRMIKTIPANGTPESVIRPMLMISYFLRMMQRNEEAALWSRSACWAHGIMKFVEANIAVESIGMLFPGEEQILNGAVFK